jgi:hypothetical protein
LAYDLYTAGYEIFRGFAVVGDTLIPGLAFTTYETYASSGESVLYRCGFIQLSTEETDTEKVLTAEDVSGGIAVVPLGGCDTETGYILSMGISIPSYSGIYHDYYFRYDQVGDYRVAISIRDNHRSEWDEEIDLFNFNEGRFVFKGDMSYKSIAASPYYSDEAKAYAAARHAIDQIIEFQETNAYKVEKQVIMIFTEAALNEYLLNIQEGTINGFLLEKINEIEVGENQFVVVTTEGVTVETVMDTDALARERLTNGIIGLVSSALLVAGSVFITVATCGAGAPLAISAICAVAGTGATLYGMSQMIEAGQEIYYGATGDIYSESLNPVLECFKAAIPDDELATKVYHIWGISSSLVQALVVPANAAITLSRSAGVATWPIKGIIRAVAVEAVKMGITAAASIGVGYGAEKLTVYLTGFENAGKLVGFGFALTTGFLTYRGLTKIDGKYNFSGLHSKKEVLVDSLDWSLVDKKGQTRVDHINGNHGPNAPANPQKPVQTFFNDDPVKIINEAWSMKGNMPGRVEGATTVYDITMPNVIGTQGETTVHIVVMTASNQLVTAYPVVP